MPPAGVIATAFERGVAVGVGEPIGTHYNPLEASPFDGHTTNRSSSFLALDHLIDESAPTPRGQARRRSTVSFLAFEPTPAFPAGGDRGRLVGRGLGELPPMTSVVHKSSSSTSFANCSLPSNPFEIPLMKFNEKRYGRKWFGWDGIPCRSDEEESCNAVHATCARVVKLKTVTNLVHQPPFKKPGRACDALGPDEDNPSDPIAKSFLGAALAAAKSFVNAFLDQGGTPESACHARMFDMPYGLFNNWVDNIKGKNILRILNPFMRKPAMDARLQDTVWGTFVHGKTGTWAFDSGGMQVGGYIYQIPQGNGAPSDYYLCDDHAIPHQCALLGGNMRAACGEFYDPVQCGQCEDLGYQLKCEVRGWNDWYQMWAKVPIYPRDMLGELYRDEWRDVMGRPQYATVTILKADLAAAKQLGIDMIQPKGPASKALNADFKLPIAADMAGMHPFKPMQLPGPAPPPGPLAGLAKAVSSMLELHHDHGTRRTSAAEAAVSADAILFGSNAARSGVSKARKLTVRNLE